MIIPLFPLGTVLVPGAGLPLKVFEQRYLDMTRDCLRDGAGFGVCLIREGREVGDPAVPAEIGCLASIEQWDMPTPGMFHLLARGDARFRVTSTTVSPKGLISGTVELLADAPADLPTGHRCAELVRKIVERVGADRLSGPPRYDDAAWVSWRLAEFLPLPPAIRQTLLEIDDPLRRIELLESLFQESGQKS